MKRKLIIPLLLMSLVIAFSCNNKSAKISSENKTERTDFYYTCNMHPEVHLDKPGDCPICGMRLVKKEVAKVDSVQTLEHSDTLKGR